jgi:hypothetical protein
MCKIGKIVFGTIGRLAISGLRSEPGIFLLVCFTPHGVTKGYIHMHTQNPFCVYF